MLKKGPASICFINDSPSPAELSLAVDIINVLSKSRITPAYDDCDMNMTVKETQDNISRIVTLVIQRDGLSSAVTATSDLNNWRYKDVIIKELAGSYGITDSWDFKCELSKGLIHCERYIDRAGISVPGGGRLEQIQRPAPEVPEFIRPPVAKPRY
jgi:hypothetical protein